MARVKCPICNKTENILKAGLIRNKQRYNCKNCNYHFITEKTRKHKQQENQRSEGQTSMLDIARMAGVSITTVSRALNDKTDVNKNTKKIIKDLAISM
ncbi:MAG: hypothetical protein RLZZ42_66, partial [Bacteroidota bacterium]